MPDRPCYTPPVAGEPREERLRRLRSAAAGRASPTGAAV
jgi:hypothetical protein